MANDLTTPPKQFSRESSDLLAKRVPLACAHPLATCRNSPFRQKALHSRDPLTQHLSVQSCIQRIIHK